MREFLSVDARSQQWVVCLPKSRSRTMMQQTRRRWTRSRRTSCEKLLQVTMEREYLDQGCIWFRPLMNFIIRWVAHPALVKIAMDIFDEHMKGPHQVSFSSSLTLIRGVEPDAQSCSRDNSITSETMKSPYPSLSLSTPRFREPSQTRVSGRIFLREHLNCCKQQPDFDTNRLYHPALCHTVLPGSLVTDVFPSTT